jgi:transposase InsO family protein
MQSLYERTETPMESSDIWYLHTTLCQCILPYQDPKTDEWQCTNGDFSIALVAGHIRDPESDQPLQRVGLPYGPKPLCSAKIPSSSLWTLYLLTAIIGRNNHPSQREALAMTRLMRWIRHLGQLGCMLLTLLGDGVHYFILRLRSPVALAAENLFLRKQLALSQERSITPRRATRATRLTLIWLARCFDWHRALVIVRPATLIRWHRQGFRLFWRWTARSGRPPIPTDLQALIRPMARANPTWGEEHIANELLLKLGLRVSPRTVRKYLPTHLDSGRGQRARSQRWRTFVRNHAQAIIAGDFCVVTATFRLLYVLVVIEHVTRRLLYVNVTAHPTAQWTLQQLREAIPADHAYRFLIHDRDAIFSQELDQCIRHLGLKVLKTPVRSPQANALCERLLGTMRRECLDFVIPLTENHLRHLLNEWAAHYNKGRPHMALGPGIPEPPRSLPVPLQTHQHRLPAHVHVVAHPILGGLHHEYRLEERAV